MHVAPGSRLYFFYYGAGAMLSMPKTNQHGSWSVGFPPLPAIFDSNHLSIFSFLIVKEHKAAGVSRMAMKTRQKRFLSILLDYYWISTAKLMFPLYGKERSPFKSYIYYKKNTAQKEQGTLSLCLLLAYANQHSFHFFGSFCMRSSSMHAFTRSC